MEGPGPQTVEDHSPPKSHHLIARTIYLALGRISILLAVLFGSMFLGDVGLWIGLYGHTLHQFIVVSFAVAAFFGSAEVHLISGRGVKTGVEKKQSSRLSRMAVRGVALGVMSVLLVIAIPNVLQARRPGKRYRATADTKTAVTQAIVYENDYGVYPTSLKVLREAGYANVTDKDPWGNEYVLSPVLTEGRTPREGGNVYVFSRGPKGTGVYPQPFTHNTGEDGSIGYSSVHGRWGPPLSRGRPGLLDFLIITFAIIWVYILIKFIAFLIDLIVRAWVRRSWIGLAAICSVTFLAIFGVAGGHLNKQFLGLLAGLVFWFPPLFFLLRLFARLRKADSEDQLSRDDWIGPTSWS